MSSVAKVRILSPVSHLDKIFDYAIPQGMIVEFGQLVKVPFGKGKSKSGVVVGISSESDFPGALLEILALESQNQVLTVNQLALVEATADRYAGTVSGLLQNVIPTVAKRVDKSVRSTNQVGVESKSTPNLTYLELKPANGKSWVDEFLTRASAKLDQGFSSMIIVPDFRDISELESGLEALGLKEFSISHDTNLPASTRYQNHLRANSEIAINYGLRSACFKPANNLGAILLLDDVDESHFELTVPYWHSREVSLLRQRIELCDLTVASYSPSADVVRLIDIGFLTHDNQSQGTAVSRCTESQNRLDDETFGLISRLLSESKPVLIQTANLGFASSLFCTNCKKVRVCPECESKVWIDPRNQVRCRNCSFNGQSPCSCGEYKTRVSRTGSSAMQAWLAKAFPASEVIHSTASERILSIPSGPKLVIATPGAEPSVAGGYSAVILSDAGSMLGLPSLRALEKASSCWAKAASKVSPDGIVIFVGVFGEVSDKCKRMDFYGLVRQDYLERAELELPPSTRIGSVVLDDEEQTKRITSSISSELMDKVRLIQTEHTNRVSFIYQYKFGSDVAGSIQKLVRQMDGQLKSKKLGIKSPKVIMDDWQAI